MNRILPFVLFLVIITGCNPYYDHIGDGYYVSSDKEYGVTDIVYDCSDLPARIDSFIFYDTLQLATVVKTDSGHHVYGIVDEHVTGIEHDDNFILAEQKPKDKFNEWYPDVYDPYKFFRDQFDFHEYWIVDKRTNCVYGPLSIGQYYIYREKLGVPDNLKLFFEKGETAQFFEQILSYILVVGGGILFFAVLAAILILPILLIVWIVKLILRRIKTGEF